MNKQMNKRSVVATLIVCLVCLVIVTGSTFSLFTSESNVNIAVTSGEVKMTAAIAQNSLKLYSKGADQTTTGKFANGGFATLEPGSLTLTNITPGDGVTFNISLTNSSNVDIAYRVVWTYEGKLGEALIATANGADITSGTSQWITWTEQGTETIEMAIDLPIETGNEYQGEKASIEFYVEAVQANGTGDWKKDAYVNTADGLQAAVNSGATEITLNDDIDLENTLVFAPSSTTYSLRSTPIVLDLNGNTLSVSDMNAIRNDGAYLQVINGTIERTGTVAGYAFNNAVGMLELNKVEIIGGLYTSGSVLNVTDSSIIQPYSGRHAIYSYNCATTIESGKYHNENSGNSAIMAAGTSVVTINGGEFSIKDGRPVQNWTSCLVDSQNGSAIVINGGTFNGGFRTQGGSSVTINNGSFNDVYGSGYNVYTGGIVTINGGVFTDTTSANYAKKYAAEGLDAVANVDGTYTIMPSGFESVASGLYKKDNTYYVYSVEGFKYFSAKELTGNNGVAESVSIVLEADLDMQGAEFSAIITQRGDSLTFNGNGHKISNIKLISGVNDNTTGQASMFYAYPNSTLNVSDLVIENAEVIADNNDSGYAAVVIGYCEGTANLTNVDVINATVTGAKSSGLIVGHLSGSLTAKNCDLDGTVTLTDYENGGHYAGKYIGTLAGAAVLTDCTVNATIDGNLNAKNLGDIYGRSTAAGSITIDGNKMIANGLCKAEDTNTYFVYSAAGLAALNAKMVDKSAGQNVVINIMSDIDFAGKTWTTVDSHVDFGCSLSAINGNGYTISNLTVSGQAMFSRFAGLGDVSISNLTFDGAKVSTASINTALIVGQTYQNLLLDNVDVKNSTVTGGYKVATLIGTIYNEKSTSITATIKDCDVDNCVVTSVTYDFMTCGLVAFVYEGDNDYVKFENTTISNVTIDNTNSGGYSYHAFLYYTDAPVDDCFNEAEGVTVTNCKFDI
ncbi:MAG: hypothetical protein J6V80_01770 [Clostridia bacterium]|nr:hypothetical protein [Clostridia bacterium]